MFQCGLKYTLDVNISKGTSEIIPNIKRFIKYFFLLVVLKNPSTIKNIKIGKAILPSIEKILDITGNIPSLSRKGVIIALLKWSMNIERNAIYFKWAPFKIWNLFNRSYSKRLLSSMSLLYFWLRKTAVIKWLQPF